MLPPRSFRRGLLPMAAVVTFCCLASPPAKATIGDQVVQLKEDAGVSITDFGAVGDGTTLNTKSIQAAIDHTAGQGGGTVVIPAGLFVSGAIFLKPKVNLCLKKGGVLRCSTDMKNFPQQRTRIEGHFEKKFTPALINAEGCDGLQLTGAGTLDGNGRPLWDQFWKLRHTSGDKKNFNNLSVPRARLCLIENSKDVAVRQITFKDSQFWNLHLYHDQKVLVEGVRFQVPDNYKQAPSTDGIDVDSCQDVAIKGCYFSVTDDCIALKGSKGTDAIDDKNSPPVEHVRVSDCTFRRGDAAVTCGSEATIVRDLVVDNCRITGAMNVLRLKLRSDTPQRYEDLHLGGLTLDNAGGTLVNIAPWTQYTDLKGEAVPPPTSTVRTITISNVKGRYGKVGTIQGNQGQTKISDIALKNIDVQFKDEKFKSSGVTDLTMKNVSVNGVPVTPKD